MMKMTQPLVATSRVPLTVGLNETEYVLLEIRFL